MTNGEKFIDVFGVACGIYDEKNKETIIQLKGDWWDKEYEGEETITDKITDNEALEILEEVMEMDDSMYQYNQKYLDALNMALDALKFKKKADVVISQLRTDRDRLATALEEIRAEIDRQQKWLLNAGYTAYNVDIALDAIKSVAVESEGKE